MHPHEEIIRTAVGHFTSGNLPEFLEHFTEDLVVHVPPGHQLSGDYQGREQFVAKFVGSVMEITGGIELELHDVLASDEHAVGIYQIRAQRDGTPYEWSHVNVYHFRDGKISEFWWTPFDQQVVAQLFA